MKKQDVVLYLVLGSYLMSCFFMFTAGVIDTEYTPNKCIKTKRWHYIVPTYKAGCHSHKYLRLVGDWLTEEIK